MPEPIDYRALLVKYIGIVMSAEGVDFLMYLTPDAYGLTEAELAELRKCSKEAE